MNFHFLLEELNDSQPTAVNDQHTCVVFAQGLQALGIQYHGNIRFLKSYETDSFLIDTSGAITKDTILVTACPHRFKQDLSMYSTNGNRIIIFDTRDQWNRHEFDVFIPITNFFYRSSYHISTTQKNIYPFAFSLSNRIINVTKHVNMAEWGQRKNVILEAHRVTNHSVRNFVIQFYMSGKCPIPVERYNDKFEEPAKGTEEYFHWCQTGRRHSEQYYNKLASVQMIDAHGGYFGQNSVVQIDSWKLWEGFAAGCLVLALDFKYYGIKMPFDLVGYKHYIPIRYDKIEESYAMLNSLSVAQRKKIAENGREYVLKNYCPQNIASYICSNIS